MVNPNAWYIIMHFDRLSKELLVGVESHVEDESQKKKQKPTVNH
jgi:hypothetical protein